MSENSRLRFWNKNSPHGIQSENSHGVQKSENSRQHFRSENSRASLSQSSMNHDTIMSSSWPRPYPVSLARPESVSAVFMDTRHGMDTLGPSGEAFRPAFSLFPPLGIVYNFSKSGLKIHADIPCPYSFQSENSRQLLV